MSTVGIDVGGTFIKAVRREADGTIADRAAVPTPRHVSEMVTVAAEVARRLTPARAVGVGLAGMVDHDRGVLVWGPHLPGDNVAVASLLAQELGVPVVVDNDANLAALAEATEGAAVGYDQAVMITLGTGIGMGVILDGAVRRGGAFAGEAGHLVVEPDGAVCACGRRGCWETAVSGSTLDAHARALLGDDASSGDLVRAARSGHEPALSHLAAAGEWLGRGLETIVLLLDPQIIVVGGAAATAGEHLLEPARRWLEGTEGASHRDPIRLTAGILGSEAGAIGAAIAAEGTV